MAKKTTLKLWTGEIWEDLFPSTHADLIIMGDGQNNLQHLMNEVVNRSDRAYDAVQGVLGQIEQIEQIAKGAQQAVSFIDYEELVNALNLEDARAYEIGQSFYIEKLNVPDLWVSMGGVEYKQYTYTTDEDFVNELKNHGWIHIGHYELCQLETGKVNIEELKTNLEKGTVTGSTQQIADGVADGFDFTGKNPNATALDSTLTGIIPYGATGVFASAFGGKSSAQGKRSHAEGTTTIAKGAYSHAEGDNSVAYGIDSHAEGVQTISYGGASHAEGSNTQAKGEGSHAEGYKTSATNSYSHAEGESTTTGGSASHAEGTRTISGGNSSHAEGSFTNAIGGASHSEGVGTNANGDFSHAEGNYTNANKRASHAEGSQTTADGECSHAEGNTSKAIGWASHAEGYGTEAKGAASHTAGQATIANIDCQTVVGKYNDNKSNTLFEVGNGAAGNRSNAFEVYNTGGAKVYGDLDVTGKIKATGTLTDEEKAAACEWLGADKKGIVYYPAGWVSSTEDYMASVSSFNLPPKIGDLVITIDGYLGTVDTFYNNGQFCNIKRLTSLKWTEDDKTEIKNSVLEALPFYTGEITVEDDA